MLRAIRSAWRYSYLPGPLTVALLLTDLAAAVVVSADPDSPVVLPYLAPALALVTVALVVLGAGRALRAHRYGCW